MSSACTDIRAAYQVAWHQHAHDVEQLASQIAASLIVELRQRHIPLQVDQGEGMQCSDELVLAANTALQDLTNQFTIFFEFEIARE